MLSRALAVAVAVGRRLLQATPAVAMAAPGAAVAVGYAIGAGSLCLYTPMIVRLCTRRSAAGLSAETWLFKLSAYTTNALYCLRRGYPLPQYLESISLAAQALVMLLLVCRLQRRPGPVAAGIVVMSAGAALLAAPSGVADVVLPGLQAAAALLGAGAVLPQILLNARQGGSGEFSVVTAALLTGGNVLRGWTTVELAGADPVLLLGAALGCASNGALLAQICFYARAEGASLAGLVLADFAQLLAPDSREEERTRLRVGVADAAGDSDSRPR